MRTSLFSKAQQSMIQKMNHYNKANSTTPSYQAIDKEKYSLAEGTCTTYTPFDEPITRSFLKGHPLCIELAADQGFYINSDAQFKGSGKYIKDSVESSIPPNDDVIAVTCALAEYTQQNPVPQKCQIQLIPSKDGEAMLYPIFISSDLPGIKSQLVAKNNYKGNLNLNIDVNNDILEANMITVINPFKTSVTIKGDPTTTQIADLMSEVPAFFPLPYNGIDVIYRPYFIYPIDPVNTQKASLSASIEVKGQGLLKEIAVELEPLKFYSPEATKPNPDVPKPEGKCTTFTPLDEPLNPSFLKGQPICIELAAEQGFYINSDAQFKGSGKYIKDSAPSFLPPNDDVKVVTCALDESTEQNQVSQKCQIQLIPSKDGEAMIYPIFIPPKGKAYLVAKNNYKGNLYYNVDKENNIFEANMITVIHPFITSVTINGNPKTMNLLNVMGEGEILPLPYNRKDVTYAVYCIMPKEMEDAKKASISASIEVKGQGKFNEIAVELEPLKFYSEDYMPSGNSNSNKGEADNGLSGGAIAGIVIAVLIVVGGAAGFCVYWFMFRNKGDNETPEA